MIFHVARESKDSKTGSGGFYEPGQVIDEVLKAMVVGDKVTILPREFYDETEPVPTGYPGEDA